MDVCANVREARGPFRVLRAGSDGVWGYLNGQPAPAGRGRVRRAERRRYSSYTEIREILVDTRDTWLEGVESGGHLKSA